MTSSKPTKKKNADARIAIRLGGDLLNALDAEVVRMQAKTPAHRVTRSEAVREAVARMVQK